jgi:hypothetical protein
VTFDDLHSLDLRPLLDHVHYDPSLGAIKFVSSVLGNPHNVVLTIPERMC